jgi:hypothetical protein
MWILVHEPRIATSRTKAFGDFGFMQKFNGVGVFVFAKESNWYITAIEDLGV